MYNSCQITPLNVSLGSSRLKNDSTTQILHNECIFPEKLTVISVLLNKIWQINARFLLNLGWFFCLKPKISSKGLKLTYQSIYVLKSLVYGLFDPLKISMWGLALCKIIYTELLKVDTKIAKEILSSFHNWRYLRKDITCQFM